MGGAAAQAWVARSPASSCRASGRWIVLSHGWSGRVRIHNLSRRYDVDLYDDQTRLILLDAVYEIILDVTQLAIVRNGQLCLPPLTMESIEQNIVHDNAWFRFLIEDKTYRPNLVRKIAERFRPRPGLRMQTNILPHVINRLETIQKPEDDLTKLLDEMRCLTAVMDGLSLREGG